MRRCRCSPSDRTRSAACAPAEPAGHIERSDRALFGKLRSAEQYRALLSDGAFEYAGMPPATLQIDTSALSVVEAASRIEQALRALQSRGSGAATERADTRER